MVDIENRDTPLSESPQVVQYPEKGSISSSKEVSSSSSASEEDIAETRERILLRQEQLQHSQPPVLPITTLFRKKESHDLNQIATQPSVFDDPATAKFFQPHPQYENLHRFDPAERWTWGEELPLINKMDWKVTLWACIAFFALDLDRGNIGQANTDNFLQDLGMTTNGKFPMRLHSQHFNLGSTIFRIAFLTAELPSQLVSKKIGPDHWIPTQIVLWSVVAASQFWLSGRSSFLICRALLGFIQGGFIPDVILYLSYFFKGTELPFRLALFWTTLKVTDIVAPILAFGLLRLRGVHGKEGWRWLFLIEGLLTLEKILVNRILRDDPSKGDMHNRQAITFKLLWKSITDFDLWPIYLIGLTFGMPGGPPDQYLTLNLRRMGFDTFDSNLLSIPNNVVGAITMLILTYYSEIFNQRAFMGLVAQLWILPCTIALALIPSVTNQWAQFALVTVLLSYPSPHAMQVAWCSRNSNTVRTRTVSAALYNMFVQTSGIAHSNIYRADDKPMYRRGNKALVGIGVLNIVIYLSVKAYYVWRNQQRDKGWNVLSEDEKLDYLENTTDSGSKRKDFRFAH